MTLSGDDHGHRAQLRRAADRLRTATATAVALDSWFAPTLDDCRVDAERLLALDDASLSAAGARGLLLRADLALRTWHKLLELTRAQPATVRLSNRCPACAEGTLWLV